MKRWLVWVGLAVWVVVMVGCAQEAAVPIEEPDDEGGAEDIGGDEVEVEGMVIEGAGTPEADQEVAAGQTFTLGMGQTAWFADGELLIRFVEIVEDSRCPADAICVDMGQVVAAFEVVEQGDMVAVFNLTLAAPDQPSASQQVGSYTLTLTEVQPYPFSSDPTEPGEYVVTLVIDG